MANLQINGLTCHVTTMGTGDPLVLLHGFTGSAANWQPHLPVLAASHHIIAPDIIGHGATGSPPNPDRYTMPQAAADLLTLLDALGIEQTALLGYSMGGRLALFTAVHHPQRFTHLVLESASPGLANALERRQRRQSDESLADWIEASGIMAFVDRWEQLPLWASQQQVAAEVRAQLRAQRLTNNPVGLANSLRGMGTGAQPSLWAYLQQVTMPVLLIAGELDSKFVAINQRMAARLPAVRLEIVAGAGHTVNLERPLLFQRLVQTFLTS